MLASPTIALAPAKNPSPQCMFICLSFSTFKSSHVVFRLAEIPVEVVINHCNMTMKASVLVREDVCLDNSVRICPGSYPSKPGLDGNDKG